MNKSIFLSLYCAGLLTACVGDGLPAPTSQPTVGIANPASQFCVKQGGKVEIRQKADGSQYGMCHFPDGRVVEEWENFRQQLQP